MPNFKSLQSLLGVPSSFEDEEELYSKMPTKEEELEAYTSTPKWSAEQYKQSITPEHREELERQQKARERTEEFEKPLEEDIGPLGALGYHVLKNIAFDERPASEFEEGGGSVYESTSPIDFITPAGVGATAKGISKAFARPGIRKAVVSEVLPATRFEKIKQELPPSIIEGKVVIPQIPPVLDSDLTKPARDAAFKEKFNLPLTHGTTVKDILEKQLRDKGLLPEEGILSRLHLGRPRFLYYDENFKKLGEVEPSSFSVFPEFNPSNTGTFGEGVYTSPRIKSKGGNVIADRYSDLYEIGKVGFQIPLMARGEKIFNIPVRGNDFLTNFPELKGIVPSFDESLEKLSKVSGIPKKELEIKGKNELTELARKYPEHFEGVSYGGEVNIFDKKNIRSPWAKFDSAKKDSADYLSGLAAAGLTFDQIKQLLDKNSSDRNEF